MVYRVKKFVSGIRPPAYGKFTDANEAFMCTENNENGTLLSQ